MGYNLQNSQNASLTLSVIPVQYMRLESCLGSHKLWLPFQRTLFSPLLSHKATYNYL